MRRLTISTMTAPADFWDQHAASFDNEADHGLRDPAVRAAWRTVLTPHLPPAPAAVADLGCGTGSLSVLLAELGYDLTGVDVSGRMIAVAGEKASRARVAINLVVGDAAQPPLRAGSFDVVLSRHVLWMFDDPDRVLSNWTDLLRPAGTLVLVEGLWSTGVGLTPNAAPSWSATTAATPR